MDIGKGKVITIVGTCSFSNWSSIEYENDEMTSECNNVAAHEARSNNPQIGDNSPNLMCEYDYGNSFNWQQNSIESQKIV